MERVHTTLVTGVNGFVGHHLAKELKYHDVRVIGTGVGPELEDSLKPYVEQYVGDCDLSNNQEIGRLPLNNIDSVINLAGLASVGASFDKRQEYLRVNLAVHTNICEAIKKSINPLVRIIAVSTGAVYDSSSSMPLLEDSPVITDGSPYALSKLGMETALRPYQDEGMDIVIVRPFNHTGPGQGPGFLVPDLLLQLQALTGKDSSLMVGNLNTKRDYTDVRDIARAYCALALAPGKNLTANLYNICSGESTSGKQILAMLLEYLKLKDQIDIKTDQSRIRPNDPPDIYGSYRLLNRDTDWKPTIKLRQTLSDFIAST